MDRDEVMEKVCEIARDIFDDDELELNDDTIAADVDGWDSLTHLSLMNEIENEFEIKFEMKEVQGLSNVGELVDVILERIS
ncbi:MAG: acyl carrier protein [Lachnospiraceae bacterium]|nr:acyl carrier protein [Lachnospiraceae bacterium]MCR5410376.1 acyl carrier protein [Lachnospiraceae bacterium]